MSCEDMYDHQVSSLDNYVKRETITEREIQEKKVVESWFLEYVEMEVSMGCLPGKANTSLKTE